MINDFVWGLILGILIGAIVGEILTQTCKASKEDPKENK